MCTFIPASMLAANAASSTAVKNNLILGAMN